MSDAAIEAAYSEDALGLPGFPGLVGGLPLAAVGLGAAPGLAVGVGVAGSAASATGSSLGVGMGVTSVEGVTSTSSASRYHFRRRV